MISTLTELRRVLQTTPSKKVKHGCGGGLHLEHHPNGSAYYLGRMTINIEGRSKRSEVHIGTNKKDFSLKEAREHFEKEYLSTQLKKHHGNISKTADFIGMERSALHRKLKSLGIKGIN